MCFLLDFNRSIHVIYAHRVKTARKIRAPREYMRFAHNCMYPLKKPSASAAKKNNPKTNARVRGTMLCSP
jgi:hypothetical protein